LMMVFFLLIKKRLIDFFLFFFDLFQKFSAKFKREETDRICRKGTY